MTCIDPSCLWMIVTGQLFLKLMIPPVVLTGASATISWKGKKLKRIVTTSSTAGETLALNEVLSEVVFVKALIGNLCGPALNDIPVNLYTDSKNVVNAVNSTSMV